MSSQNAPATKPADSLIFDIRMTSNSIKHYMDRIRGHSKTGTELTWVESLTLGVIANSGSKRVTAKEIMEEAHVSKATVSQTLSSLWNKGFIETKERRDDHRVKDLVLLRKGREALDSLRAEVEAAFRYLLLDVTEEEKAVASKIIRKIAKRASGEVK